MKLQKSHTLLVLLFVYLVVPVNASTDVYTHVETSSEGGNSTTHVETNVDSKSESTIHVDVENNGMEIHKKVDTEINGRQEHIDTTEPAKPVVTIHITPIPEKLTITPVATVSPILIPTIHITPPVNKTDLEKSIKTFIHDLLSEIASSLRRQ